MNIEKNNSKEENYVESIVKTLKYEAKELNKNLVNYRQNKDMNLYISTLKSLRETMNLIHEYDWQENHSCYKTGEDNHIEVATWEQNSNGEIKNQKRYIVSKEFTDKEIGTI